ncbi:MAG: type ISP restriction/modification enzyme, partial [Flavobacteriaceae bacterium]|nr:type ISP restriction/modification enzyme [Flavobacteriaceae bacterium]
VWYTPQPVVNFIVRAVDDILKTEFDLPQGLADTSKTTIKKKAVTQTGTGANSKIKEVEHDVEVHKVQILDPATGTGTFLAEVVKHIYKKFEGQQGIWSKYVTNDLIPRLNGFELLMASYAMAHLKMDMLLTETGYKPADEQRFRIFLTNSLEEAHPDTATLFSSWLSDEADQANAIKRDAPVMVVMGNPPYSGESSNKGQWIMDLMDVYKKEPGGKEKLKERNPKWINDDYVKFLRYGQHFIERNGSGVLAFINPHGYLDNPTFRGMRWNLLKTYDKIYTIDLHGNSKKKETAPDGSTDQNVFDIMQGVSINIFVKIGKKKTNELGKIFHYDLYGKREMKYEFLIENSLKTTQFIELPNVAPNYFFVPKDFEAQLVYDKGFKINELFPLNSVGIVTSKDAILINDSKIELIKNVEDYYNIEVVKNQIEKISYRPFDEQYIYNDNTLIERARVKLMQHFLLGKNLGLVAGRQCASEWRYIFISKLIGEFNLTGTAGRYGSGNYFPLYLYYEKNGQQSLEDSLERTPNLSIEIVEQIANGLGLIFTNEKETESNVCFANSDEVRPDFKQSFAPIDLLDYIYAVLHSPTYREKYKEFLKIDFPRVPYPKDAKIFWKLVEHGGELREIHLLESPKIERYITKYPEDGDNIVTKPRYENSPPLEGCPQGGVVPYITTQDPIIPDILIKNNAIFFNSILELPYNIKLKSRAKELRQAENLSEVLFWMQVTKNQFYKIDFDRQRIIGNYIVDFYVKKLGLVIEIDGSSHNSKEEYDKLREEYLLSLGLKMYRIPVIEVLQNIKSVMRDLEVFIIENYGKPSVSSIKDKEPPRPLGTPPKEGNLGNVFINDTQYFADIPTSSWEFYIGGYQPAQKWLKDRKGRELSYDDILHYQKIIVALSETDRIMKEIDMVKF